MRLAILAGAMLVFAGSAADAATPVRSAQVVRGPIAETIDRQLTDAAANRGFGGAVVVEFKGKVLLRAGYGLANRERAVPFTPDTPAQIGSITKTFTGLLLSQLIAEGKIDPNATLRTYLPNAPEPAGSTTINQLLTHTGGLSDYCGDDYAPRPRAELISDCMARPLEFPVGSSNYSNMGVSFAAVAAEQVTGLAWEEALRRRIWRPLGLRNTGWTFPGRSSAGFATGYLNGENQGVISDRIAALNGADWNLKGNGGIQASAADMHRFFRGIMRQPAAVRAIMLQSHADGDSPDVKEGYGLFFRLGADGKPYRVGHGGSDGVFYSYFAWYPKQDAFLYYVGNSGEDNVRTELRGVLVAVQDGIGLTTPAPRPAS